MLRWGLIPPWATQLKGGPLLINARVETVASKAPFASLIGKASRRALQVADGYYEWLAPERRGEPRQPFHFQLDGGVPFAFAALWNPTKVAGDWIESVTLLTCDSKPNRVAAAIHDRMPVILADEQARRAWLSPELDAEDVLGLCEALPERAAERPSGQPVGQQGRPGHGGTAAPARPRRAGRPPTRRLAPNWVLRARSRARSGASSSRAACAPSRCPAGAPGGLRSPRG